VRDEASDAAARPDEAVLLEEHEGFGDHGAADLYVDAEFGLRRDHGVGSKEAVVDVLCNPRVHRHVQR
jgi:hypothetical protein